MLKIALVMGGGALGSLFRYLISEFSSKSFTGSFPYGTLIVNLTGSFFIGLCWAFFLQGQMSTNVKTFLFIGILGGFTTFSSFSAETMHLFRDNEIKMGLLNILANNIFGLLLVFGGFYIGKQIVSLIN
ncbi:MAG: fluoride efflux transporter CrcB [Bacteroidetes bacterium HGW-Bacteroidetes-21]|jgi:CrcB protein|nr:MAG: fluoride efflux transporter CrcB [Bacteroidetes bacterium HGW-Bacteroidetes-21]